MSAGKIAAVLAFALSLCGASAMADGAGSRPGASRGHGVAGSPLRATAAPTAHASGSKAHKAPAIKRTPKRDRSTDLELPQLG